VSSIQSAYLHEFLNEWKNCNLDLHNIDRGLHNIISSEQMFAFACNIGRNQNRAKWIPEFVGTNFNRFRDQLAIKQIFLNSTIKL
jgi:hypothetical protein